MGCTGGKTKKDSNQNNNNNKENKTDKTNAPTAATANAEDDSHLKNEEKEQLSLLASTANIRDVYHFQQVLGSGGFGIVKLAKLISNPNKKVAIKIIEKRRLKNKIYMLLRELQILKTLDHPNIIKFYEIYQDEMFFYICQEHCSGGELLTRITKQKFFREREAAQIMIKLFSAVNHMHIKGIVHRDLKPENILFDSNEENCEIKIIDFGLSNKFDPNMQENLSTMVGTPMYVSPQVLKGKYTQACDVWSLGVIMYILLCGYPPFYGKNKGEIFDKIENEDVKMTGPEWDRVSETAKDLIRQLLQKDDKKRFTCKQAMENQWFDNLKKNTFQGSQLAIPDDKIDPRIINLLATFKSTTKLKQEIMKVLVNQMSEKDIHELKEAFRKIDKNNTGLIGIEDLRSAMQQSGFQMEPKVLEHIFKEVSQENDGKLYIRYTEFITATLDLRIYLTKEKLWSLFKYFDPNNQNFISADDLQEIFKRQGKNVSKDELIQLINEAVPNHDGKITFNDFVKIMKDDVQIMNDIKNQEEKE